MYAMAKMLKNGQRAGDSNWTPKVAPRRVVILEKLAILAKMMNLDGRNRNCVHFWTYLYKLMLIKLMFSVIIIILMSLSFFSQSIIAVSGQM